MFTMIKNTPKNRSPRALPSSQKLHTNQTRLCNVQECARSVQAYCSTPRFEQHFIRTDIQGIEVGIACFQTHKKMA